MEQHKQLQFLENECSEEVQPDEEQDLSPQTQTLALAAADETSAVFSDHICIDLK